METDILKLVLFQLYLKGEIVDMSFNGSGLAEVRVDLEELKKTERHKKSWEDLV